MRAILAAALLMTGVASTAAGQTWSELQERGRHAEAAEALQALVLNALSSPDMFFPDVEATISLARLYAEGRGVEQDRVVGCSFAELAYHAAAFRHPDPQHPAVHRVELARAAACDDLAPDDRQEAVQMMACPVYGPELQSFALDAHHVADVSRRGIVIRQAGAEQVEPLPAFGCPRRLALARHTVVPDGRTSPGIGIFSKSSRGHRPLMAVPGRRSPGRLARCSTARSSGTRWSRSAIGPVHHGRASRCPSS